MNPVKSLSSEEFHDDGDWDVVRIIKELDLLMNHVDHLQDKTKDNFTTHTGGHPMDDVAQIVMSMQDSAMSAYGKIMWKEADGYHKRIYGPGKRAERQLGIKWIAPGTTKPIVQSEE